MASFTSRWSEIEKGFDEAYKIAIQDVPEEDVVYAQQVRMKAVLRGYIDKRNKALEGLLKMLQGFSDSLTEKNQADLWKDTVSKHGQEAFKTISDLDDDDNASILNVFVLGVATQEGDFFHKLSTLQHGAIQGFMCENAKTLREERSRLGDKWSATKGKAKSLNEKSEIAGKQALEAFTQALKEIGNANRRAAELVRNTAVAFKKFQDAQTGTEPGVPDLLEEGEGRLGSLVHNAEDVARLYRDAYKSKETTLVLYGNHREAVREFLDKTNLESALKRSAEAQKEALSIAGSMMTKGQQDDAKAFVYEANKAIAAPVQFYEKGFNEFVTEFKGIFIGPIGNNILDELLKGNFWQATEDSFERINFESELKDYYDEAEDMWNIPLSGLDDKLQRAFKDQFKRELREYDDAVEDAILTYRRVAKMLFYDYPVARLKDMVSRYKGWDG